MEMDPAVAKAEVLRRVKLLYGVEDVDRLMK
jgi:hypothetical protein